MTGLEFPNSISIPVLNKHIKQGSRRDTTGCPLVLAIRDAIVCDWVSVGHHEVFLGDNLVDSVEYSHKVDRWISSYDAGNNVEPITVILMKKKEKNHG